MHGTEHEREWASVRTSVWACMCANKCVHMHEWTCMRKRASEYAHDHVHATENVSVYQCECVWEWVPWWMGSLFEQRKKQFLVQKKALADLKTSREPELHTQKESTWSVTKRKTSAGLAGPSWDIPNHNPGRWNSPPPPLPVRGHQAPPALSYLNPHPGGGKTGSPVAHFCVLKSGPASPRSINPLQTGRHRPQGPWAQPCPPHTQHNTPPPHKVSPLGLAPAAELRGREGGGRAPHPSPRGSPGPGPARAREGGREGGVISTWAAEGCGVVPAAAAAAAAGAGGGGCWGRGRGRGWGAAGGGGREERLLLMGNSRQDYGDYGARFTRQRLL